MERAPERKPVYETVTPEKAPAVKAGRPYPEREEPAAKQPKLQEPDDRYHADLHMQLEGDTELPPFEKRIALFGAAPPEEPRVSPQKRTPSQSPLMPRKPLDTGKEKPWFTKVPHKTQGRRSAKQSTTHNTQNGSHS